jgi:hypothetical protein
MRSLRALWLRLTHGGSSAQEIEAELESHVRMDTDEEIRAGLSEQEARRQGHGIPTRTLTWIFTCAPRKRRNGCRA